MWDSVWNDLDKALPQLKNKGVKILGKPSKFRGTKQRAVFVEGPDRILIQLVEGHAVKK